MKGIDLDVKLKPGAAPGCRYSGAMLITMAHVEQCHTQRVTPGVDGMAVGVKVSGDEDLRIRVEVAMPAARETLVALYRDYFNNYLTMETYARDHGLTIEEANALITVARKVEGHPHPES